MALESNVSVNIVYASESTFGTPAAAGGSSKALRRISSSLALAKDSFASEEVRADRETSDMRHGMRSVSGAISGELALGSWDDFIEAVLGGTWAAGATKVGTDSVTTSANAVTRGAGSWITDGFKIGDVVRFTGLPDAANNSKNITIVGLTATDLTSAETLVVNAVGDSAWTCTVQGYKLATGTTRRSFTIEQNYPTIDVTERYDGCRIGSMKLNLQPNKMVGIAFDVMGKDGTILSGASAPYFTSVTAAGVTGVASANTGAIRMNSAAQAVVTSVDLSIENGLSNAPVVGSNLTPDIFYGVRKVTGSVNLFIEDSSILAAYSNETEIDLMIRANTTSVVPEDFYAITINRLKLQGATKSVNADGGVIITCPFQALLKTGGAGTAYDQTSISVQRSV